MSTPQNKTRSTNELPEAVSQLKPREFDKFVKETLALRAKRNAPSASRKESKLLLKIN